MEQTIVKPEESNNVWYVLYGVLAVLAVVVYGTTDVGPWATIAGTAGLLFALLGLRSLWQWLSARAVERSPIVSLDGYAGAVEIEGAARPAGEPLTAPLTGTECVAYRVEVARWSPSREESD